MHSNIQKIRNIFAKKMAISLVFQFLILFFIVIFLVKYKSHDRVNSIINDLIIKDQYTLEQIGSYKLLGLNYALDLELHNLSSARKLDSIHFIDRINSSIYLRDCELSRNEGFKLCKINKDEYMGVSAIKIDGEAIGYILTVKKYLTQSYSIFNNMSYILITIMGIFIINFGFLFFPIKRKIERNTTSLLKLISFDFDSKKILDQIDIEEYKIIANKFVEERNCIVSLQEDKSYYQARKEISEQVAHDIRSPLAALTIITSQDLPMPEESRILLRNIINRIRDIANDLIEKNRDLNSIEYEGHLVQLITAITYPIITEKRMELQNSKISISFDADFQSYGLFVKVNPVEFKRLMSNIINNAIESINHAGEIKITLCQDENHIHLTICDNGKGIPPHILKNLGKRKVSHGKSGSGLGLFHAKQTMDEFGGTIRYISEVNIGTRVILGFPKEKAPSWFLPNLSIVQNAILVIIDDDLSIHHMWDKRLHRYISNLDVMHFGSIDEFKSGIDKLKERNQQIFYLFDFEYVGCLQNGLDIIKEFNLENSSVLVTSHSEENRVRMQCEALSIKMIPKDLVAFVPIAIHPPECT